MSGCVVVRALCTAGLRAVLMKVNGPDARWVPAMRRYSALLKIFLIFLTKISLPEAPVQPFGPGLASVRRRRHHGDAMGVIPVRGPAASRGDSTRSCGSASRRR